MEMKSKFRRCLTKVGTVRLNQIWGMLRKPFNFCWKAGLAVVAVLFVIEAVDELVHTCRYNLGLVHYHWSDEDLGKNIKIRHFSKQQAAAYGYHACRRGIP